MKYSLGKVDYLDHGRRDCEAAITWELKDGRFSMCAEIWNARHTDIYQGGQCVDTVAAYAPHDKKAKRMVEVWKRWHLNDMRAGSPAQEQYLREHPISYVYPTSHYDKASEVLEAAGLNPDNGYKYGSAWLREDLPADVLAEIRSW